MEDQGGVERYFKSIGATPDFHKTVRQLSVIEEQPMHKILDSIALPVLQKRLAKLNAKAAK